MRKNIKKKLIIIFSLLVIILFSIKQLFFHKKSYIDTIAANVSYPILWTCSKIANPIEKYFLHKKNYHKLLSENILLKEENEDLLKENVELKSTISFAEKSNVILDFKNRYHLNNAVFAKIITKNISDNEHYIFINKGKIDNIKKDTVAIYKFQIIGRVTEVFRWFSKVLLITDKKCKIAAYTNNTNASGICQGKNNIKKLNFDFVNHFSNIEENDFIISSGQGLVIPEGFCLGKILKYKKDGLYYNIELKPLVSLEKLENCLIIDKEQINII